MLSKNRTSLAIIVLILFSFGFVSADNSTNTTQTNYTVDLHETIGIPQPDTETNMTEEENETTETNNETEENETIEPTNNYSRNIRSGIGVGEGGEYKSNSLEEQSSVETSQASQNSANNNVEEESDWSWIWYPIIGLLVTGAFIGLFEYLEMKKHEKEDEERGELSYA